MGVFLLRFVAFRFHESPKFLMYRGKDAAAVTVLEKVSQFNKRECNLTLEMLQSLTDEDDSMGSTAPMMGSGKNQLQATWTEKLKMELGRYNGLFSSFTMARLTILIWLIYPCDFWGFTIAGKPFLSMNTTQLLTSYLPKQVLIPPSFSLRRTKTLIYPSTTLTDRTSTYTCPVLLVSLLEYSAMIYLVSDVNGLCLSPVLLWL